MLFTQEEGRKGSLAALILLVLPALAVAPAPAQSWSVPFNHNEHYNGSDGYTHPYSPWSSVALNPTEAPAPIWWQQPTVPASVQPIHNVSISAGLVFVPGYTWPRPATAGGRSMNAVHMTVLPKGPYRGMVLVWDDRSVVATTNPPFAGIAAVPAGHVQSYQPYAIVDPADAPLAGIRYRNFLVPIGTPFVPGGPIQGKSLFCAGHALTPFGDLVVSGGTDFKLVPPPDPQLEGGFLTYVFNPREFCTWPLGAAGSTPVEYYPSPLNIVTRPPSASDYYGMWVQAPDLGVRRWYPTVTLTHRISRGSGAAAFKERVAILGGVETVSPTLAVDRARLSYEAYVVLDEAAPLVSNLVPDVAIGYPLDVPSGTALPPTWPAIPPNRVWNGPGYDSTTSLWTQPLGEYPRCFLLLTGELFSCGYEPRAARVDHESPGYWTLTPTQPGTSVYSSNWPHERHDGSAVLFPNLGGNSDVVLRLGGAHGFEGPTTDAAESIAAGSAGSTWTPAASLPPEGNRPDGSRAFGNTVILPTGALLVLGGQWQEGYGAVKPLYDPMLFEDGSWEKMPGNQVVSRRTYHSTAVLLPDGRVFVGGGDDRDWDYEIFSPPYLNDPVVRPRNPNWQAPVPFLNPELNAHELSYGMSYEILCNPLPLGHAITKAVLTAPCSVTHHSDMHQRYVELQTDVERGNHVVFHMPAPAAEAQAPRGIYMLWLITNAGTPSVAQWVVLR
jgi:hypothetical protein